jgi:saccharopepsin
VDLTAGTLSTGETIPTVTDNLVKQGTITENTIGVFYAPVGANDGTGELTFGGIDSSKITSDVTFVPITSKSPASQFWGIDLTANYGGQTLLDKASGIVDTGTTLILLASGKFYYYYYYYFGLFIFLRFLSPPNFLKQPRYLRNLSNDDQCHGRSKHPTARHPRQ